MAASLDWLMNERTGGKMGGVMGECVHTRPRGRQTPHGHSIAS